MKINRTKVELLMADMVITQTTLSKLSAVSKTNLSYILSGQNCRPQTAAKIATGLGVAVQDIIE